MRRINQNGITSIEILICFSITSIIVISMFKAIDSYKDRQDLESYKSTITTYKNILTKTIEDEIIKRGGVYQANVITNTEDNPNLVPSNEYHIELEFKDSSKILMKVIKETYCTSTGTICDPNTVKDDELDYKKSSFYVVFNNEKIELPKVYALQFNEVFLINEDGFAKIFIGIHHPDLGDKYNVLNIITPLLNAYPNALGI